MKRIELQKGDSAPSAANLQQRKKAQNAHAYADATALPDVLKKWRRENAIKIETAAADLKISPACWGHWETGARFPGGRELVKLSEYTGIPVSRLLCPHAGSCPRLSSQ